ncbi:MAG: tripartite tricarboxylate transporter substrate binding protein [Deltaproteobacteria bacterium]|nr:tripartite tricarboxylate transporter substrate binding protein [Deltaproteobacteria bacterium]MBW2017572.1 tripartite tricarboxylate transporter substrate binding protein [Deltaproteobacteria bacterium]MBW2130248.1 tripartite tricarboxylate transporter substrate binding protein [Deltaproteobacteria bacterium]MBW2302545.1 tripartite tricarboxylate transporter substrate binding protein [Deltaproteobacteria bacterium]
MLKKALPFCLVVLACACFLFGGTAHAKWPKKPVQIVIPWPPANDPSTMVTTAMAPLMAKELGVPVKVINHPGGSGVLGANKVAKARPDGYTVGLISIGPMITQVLRGKTPYKNQDFKPLGLIWSSPFTLACRADAPYKNLKELAEYGKTHDVRLAHWGLGAVPTLIALNAAKIGGFKFKETAYKKLNPLLVVSGDADVITFSTPGLRDYVDSGKMRLLACMLPNRLPYYPDVPTVKEQGFGEAYSIWFGLFVPAKTPDDRAKRLGEVFFKVMALPEIQKIIQKVGVIPHPIGPEQARKQMDSELANFGAIMKELGIIK